MKQESPDTKEKIILPESLQREMMKFFLRTSAPKRAERRWAKERESQQTSPKSEGALTND